MTAYNEIFVNENGKSNGPRAAAIRIAIFCPNWKVDRTRYDVGYLEPQHQRVGSAPRWAQVLVFAMSVDF